MTDITELRRERERLFREIFAAEARINSLTQWGRPNAETPTGEINGRILASLEARLPRLKERLGEIDAVLPASTTSRHDDASLMAQTIRFKKIEPVPIGTLDLNDSIIPPLPDCLRRSRHA